MILSRPMLRLVACATFALAGACGGDETQAPDDHTPATFTVLIDDAPVTSTLTLPAGETVRVRIKFANAAGDDLDEVEAEHFGGLTFSPAVARHGGASQRSPFSVRRHGRDSRHRHGPGELRP